MGDKITINKLTVAEVMEIQDLAKEISDDEQKGFEIIKGVIAQSIAGADELTEEEWDSFPLEELTSLSTSIMEFSGMTGAKQPNKS